MSLLIQHLGHRVEKHVEPGKPQGILPFQILILRSRVEGNLVIERCRGKAGNGADLGKQTYFICTWSSREHNEFIFNTLHPCPLPLPKIKLK